MIAIPIWGVGSSIAAFKTAINYLQNLAGMLAIHFLTDTVLSIAWLYLKRKLDWVSLQATAANNCINEESLY